MWHHAPWRILLLPGVVPVLCAYLVGRAGLGALKQSFIRCCLGGSARTHLEAWTARFVPRLLLRGAFPAALARVAEHRRHGDHMVLMSASTSLYVPVIARALGFQETLCTQLLWNGERLDGRLTSANCRGAEKVRQFTALQQRHPGVRTAAYGNAWSDLPHLRLATHGVLVNGGRKARRAARALGLSCVNWR
jgi:HAD superfamily phosphoserine phosphatase-like hydrolase